MAERPGRRVASFVVRAVTALVAIGCVAVAAVPLYGTITKSYRLLPILSGSMEPQMERGDLAWMEPRPLATLAVGDVLVFNSPVRGSTPSIRVIHRVIEIVDPAGIRTGEAVEGAVYVRTKGDANPDADPWIAAIEDEQVWVRTKVVPDAGWPLIVLGDIPPLSIAMVVGGIVLVGTAISMLRGAMGEAPTPPVTPVEPPAPAPAAAPAAVGGARPALMAALALATLVLGATGLAAAAAALLVDNETTVAAAGAGAVTVDLAGAPVQITATDLLPGDEAARVVELRNRGTVAIGSLQVEMPAAGADPLLRPTGGLQLRVEHCAAGWAGAGTTASCAGGARVVVPQRPAVGRADVPLGGVGITAPGGTASLRVVLRLPEDAPADLAGRSTTVALRFVARQRPGVLR